MKTMKGGFGKENGKLVFSPEEQIEVDRIKTTYKDKATWFKIDKFKEYLKKNGKEIEYNAAIIDRRDSDLLTTEFSTGSLYM